ncbi:MAG: ribonuclease P protein component [Oscillospiraceae bacterium]|nr:ribonuclease P protein component [Oscillospiraceae bacterium]
MKYTVSLKQNHIFSRLYAKGKRHVTPQLVLYARKNGSRSNRLGLTVGTKLGHAVTRNRVRRRLREIYRLHEEQLLGGYDLVVVARVRAVYSKYGELDRAFLTAAKALGLLRKEAGKP